ncbi:MAG: hypothetical protein IPK82_33510 [Polyangiaceae bacterium]|nr:hypothetical protein [Polyangiaceae bacterium]
MPGPRLLSAVLRRPVRFALAVAVATAFSSPVFAAPAKDAEAEKVLKDAMESDYFETRFDKAEEKIRAALEKCGKGCSEGMKAKLYIGLGTVLAGGRKELDDAQEAFVEALKLDPKAVPDPDLASAQVQFAFEKAKAELKIGTSQAVSASPTVHKQPIEQRVHTAVPIYFEVMPDVIGQVSKVSGSYAGTSSGAFTPLEFRKLGERGYGAEVPCDEVLKEGELKYFVTVMGEGDKVIGTIGSRTEPIVVSIRASITSEAPRWPGFSAPEQCAARSGDPDQCLDDRQCNSGLVCKSGQCVASKEERKILSNWVTVTFAPDFGLYSGTDVCMADGLTDNNFVCLRDDDSRYRGNPTLGQGNNVNFGFVLGTMRVAAQYERVIVDNFTLGLRAGFAFNGASGQGVDFLPVHVEGRVGYSFGKDAFEGKGVRPFAFLSGGLAQVDSKVNVQVLEDGLKCGADNPEDINSECEIASPDGRVEPRRQDLQAYKQAGRGFVSIGLGIAYNPLRNVGLHLAVRGGVTFPVVTGVIAPEAGLTFGF